jgi:surface antigen
MGDISSNGYYSLGTLSRGYVVTETVFFYSWFTIADFGHVWMLTKVYINQLYV